MCLRTAHTSFCQLELAECAGSLLGPRQACLKNVLYVRVASADTEGTFCPPFRGARGQKRLQNTAWDLRFGGVDFTGACSGASKSISGRSHTTPALSLCSATYTVISTDTEIQAHERINKLIMVTCAELLLRLKRIGNHSQIQKNLPATSPSYF
jgi:hypothetical protein